MISSISSYVPDIFSGSLKINSTAQIIKNINKIAIPAIALGTFSFMMQADGGPVSYALCIATCSAGLVLAPWCPAFCLPALGAPTL